MGSVRACKLFKTRCNPDRSSTQIVAVWKLKFVDFTSVEVAKFLTAFFVVDGANAHDNLNHITLEIKKDCHLTLLSLPNL